MRRLVSKTMRRVSHATSRVADATSTPKKYVNTPLPGFDPAFYLFWHRDVRNNGLDPLTHFLEFGWKEGRDPSAGFSTRGYLAANPDVAASGINPLIHFLEFGLAEGRKGWERNPLSAPTGPQTEPAIKLLTGPRR